jgi:glycosyltransferase involved in cell wall biosynthesis
MLWREERPETGCREPRGRAGRRQRATTMDDEQTHVDGNSPLVTVVIPCYNQAHYLGEAIESVLSQSYRNFEIIVVDDGSTDNTSEVASHYEEVRLVRQENRGLAGARNSGLAEAEGEYLVFLDADDRLLPRALEVNITELAARPQCALVAGYQWLIEADGSPFGQERLLADSQRRVRPPRHIGGDIYRTILSRRYHILCGTVMYRRFVFETVGQFDPELKASEDYDLYFRIARRFPVYCHDTVIFEYRKHNSAMTRDHGRMLKFSMEVLRSQREYAKKDDVSWAAYKAGVRKVQEVEHGTPLAGDVRSAARKHEWKEALRGAYLLARYYPRGLLVLVNKRPLLERLLRDYDNQVRGKRRRHKELSSALQKERKQLQNRAKELRRLRSRNRQLEQKEQELRRRLQGVEGSRGTSRRLVELIRRWRGRKPEG